jgi:hypothetical protein
MVEAAGQIMSSGFGQMMNYEKFSRLEQEQLIKYFLIT